MCDTVLNLPGAAAGMTAPPACSLRDTQEDSPLESHVIPFVRLLPLVLANVVFRLAGSFGKTSGTSRPAWS